MNGINPWILLKIKLTKYSNVLRKLTKIRNVSFEDFFKYFKEMPKTQENIIEDIKIHLNKTKVKMFGII